MSLATRFLALLVLLPLPALAEEAIAPWGDAEIPYDTAVWRLDGSAEKPGALSLSCIAADCPEGSRVYAFLTEPNGSVEEERWRGPEPIELHAPALPFLAYRLRSGCRALDTPILSAAVVFRGRVYRLATDLGSGCNFSPAMPEGRFTGLVEAVRPR